MQPEGHHPEHIGLQKHSVGEDYPLAVVGIGNGDRTEWVISNLRTSKDLHLIGKGLKRCTFRSAKDAYEIVEWCTRHNFRNGVSEFGFFQWGTDIYDVDMLLTAEERQAAKLVSQSYKPFHAGYPGEWPIT